MIRDAARAISLKMIKGTARKSILNNDKGDSENNS